MLLTGTIGRLALALIIFSIVDFTQPCIMLLNGWSKMSPGQRAKLAKVVFVGKVVGLYGLDSLSQTHAADFEIHRILKGKHIVDDVLELFPASTVKVYGFGEKRLCYSEVYKGEVHLVFMVYEPKSRSLVARYDDIFGATSPPTEDNENDVLQALGWKPWSSWSSCTRSCSGGWQWRTRQCVLKKCDGKQREGRKCNFFKCYGIKNVGQYFSPHHPNALNSVRTGIKRHIRLQGTQALSLQTSKVFQYYFPDEYSVVLTFRPLKYTDVYLLALYDFANNLQFGIRMTREIIALDLAKSTDFMHRQWSLQFNVQITLNKWHRATLSLQAKQVTLYWDCEKAGTKILPGRFSFAPDASGTIHLGKSLAKGDRMQNNIEISEIYFIPDVDAAKQQCNVLSFSSSFTRRGSGSGSGPDPDEGEGSGISNYVDDKNQVEIEWSSWSPCSRTCGRGVRRRVMMCVNLDDSPPGKECLQALQTAEQKDCSLQNCPARCSQPCLNGGHCSSHNRCTCKTGYHGNRCERVHCRVKCHNGGRCVGPKSCRCARGYTGKQCEKPMCTSKCQNGGLCVRPNVCRCQPGYLQPTCRATCYPPCINGGSCVGPNTCLCPRGFKGSQCGKAFCSRLCLNGGHCYAPNTCSCPYGWYGLRCEKARCYPKCRNGGKCVRPNMCMCPRATYGYYCQYGSRY